ncbi:hypothetical protein CNMCM8694_008461 [Aspergillus lentulus]|nr:hypothetical protein CNMCM8060_000105 [Aspergillus lentulus]KAF4193771.1 hypothetical protein CNMCM8694_008461 [Aspergillus lentulus]
MMEGASSEFPRGDSLWPGVVLRGWTRVARLRAQIETAIYHGLHCKALLMDEAAIAKFTLHWVAVGEINVDELRNCFLYGDEKSLQSRDEVRSYVWLAEPEETAEPLKVHIKHIAPTLFVRLTQRDLSGEAKRRPYRHASEPGLLRQAARQSRNAVGEPDGIWPPPARYM